MIDPARLYHIGVVVPDLDRTIDELGTAMGYTWSSIRTMSLDFDRTSPPGRSVRIAFARPGPPWLEVIEAPTDSIWSAAGGSALHHLGFFVDNLDEESKRLESLGMAFEIGNRDGDGRLQGFAYHLNPHWGRIEIVEERLRDGMERWITEGL